MDNTPLNMANAATPIQDTAASPLSPTPSKRKTPKWTDEEDQQLFQLVNTPSNGKKSSWSTIASQMPHHTRTAKQCRERYVNNLNPDRKKSAWTTEEDETIMKLQAKLGTQWTKIADLMPGRTDNDVKNRWYTKNNSIQKKLMKNKRKATSTPDNNNSTTKSNGGKSSVPNITKRVKLTTTTQHHPTPPVNIGTNVAKGTDHPPKIGMRVQVTYGGIAHGGVIKYVSASSDHTFFDLKIQYDNGEIGDNIYPVDQKSRFSCAGGHVKLIPTKSNLSSSEVALCHELLGLQNTLKTPKKTEEQGIACQFSGDDETPSEPTKRTEGTEKASVSAEVASLNMDTEKEEEMEYDDYLFEYIAIKERGGFDSVHGTEDVEVESEAIDVDDDTSDEDAEKSSTDEYSYASSLANRNTDAIDLLCGKVFDSMKHQKAKASSVAKPRTFTATTSSTEVTGLNILPKSERSKKASGRWLCKVEGCESQEQDHMDGMCKRHYRLFQITSRHTKEEGGEDDDDSSYRPTPRTRKPSAKLKSSSFASSDGRPDGGTYYRSRKSSSSGKQVVVGVRSRPMFDILTPGPHDVLVGRGGHTNHHPGNIKWRNIVEDLKPEYKASGRLEKSEIAMSVVKQWRALDPPGRFLKRDEDSELWYDIGDADARIKCSQVLRELKSNKLQLQLNSEEDDGQLDANEDVSVSGNHYDLEPHRYLQASSPSATDSASRYSPDFYSQSNNAYARSSNRKRSATFKASVHHDETLRQNVPITLSLPKKTKAKTAKKALKKAVKKATSYSKKKVGPKLPTRKTKKTLTGAGTVVSPLDVISGRGGGSNNHPGNLRFRDEARKLRSLYDSLAREDKKAISLELVQRVRDYGGRFLKQGGDKVWHDISDTDAARKKCSQVLRENKWE